MLNDPKSAQMALLAMYAEDMYESMTDKTNLQPPLDDRISQDWALHGYISGMDTLLIQKVLGLGTPVYYGFLAHSKADPTKYVAVIRGTEGLVEWVEDAEFLPVDHPDCGQVESGFWSVYNSLSYAGKKLAQGIAEAVGNSQITVVGHSLGSALATYLCLDLALARGSGSGVSACIFASPRAGDEDFCKFFDQQVSSYTLYNYSPDLVPMVPKFFDYCQLSREIEIDPNDAQADIKHDAESCHHAICYAAMLDYDSADWNKVPSVDQNCAKSILGPSPCLKSILS